MTDENPSGRPDKFRGKRGPDRGARRRFAEAAGVSRHQMYQAIQVGNIPEDEFERLVESDDPPTITELARFGRGEQSKPKPLPMDAARSAIAKAVRAAEAAYWAACDAEGDAVDPADLDTPGGLLDAAYDVALMVQTYADENEVSWSEARRAIRS